MHSEIRHSEIGDGEVRVEAVTLEELLERFGPPDVVLMDIQGAEAAALRGAEKLLRDVRPTWVVELHGPEGLEAYELLRQAGYKLEGADHPVAAVLARQGRTHVIARP
jgi:CheY-like chemotaxis protein